MNRRLKVLLSGLLVVLFLGVVATSLNSATQEIRPVDVAQGDFDGEYVTVKGRLGNVSVGDAGVRFDVEGPNASVPARYDGPLPATFEAGRHVIVEGTVRGETVHASTVKVQAHLEGERPTSS